jgi:hypothetical protein
MKSQAAGGPGSIPLLSNKANRQYPGKPIGKLGLTRSGRGGELFRETKPIGGGCVVSNKANPGLGDMGIADWRTEGCFGRLRNDSTGEYAKQSQLAGRRQ